MLSSNIRSKNLVKMSVITIRLQHYNEIFGKEEFGGGLQLFLVFLLLGFLCISYLKKKIRNLFEKSRQNVSDHNWIIIHNTITRFLKISEIWLGSSALPRCYFSGFCCAFPFLKKEN